MGIAQHTVTRQGQTIEVGVMVDQECDEPGCTEQIVRVFDRVCGEDHGDNESGCGKYFCSQHLYLDGDLFEADEDQPQLCADCAGMRPPQDSTADGDDQDDDVEVRLEFQPVETSTPFRSTRVFSNADLAELLLAWDRGKEI
jgi:hypothetical protein